MKHVEVRTVYLPREKSKQFEATVKHVQATQSAINASGAAVLIIHQDKVVREEYFGYQSSEPNSRPIQEDTQFHVASVRKSYIGFAVSYSLYHGYISSIDDLVSDYLETYDRKLLRDTTIRHLLTHTHGLRMNHGEAQREFPAGESWAYRGIGIDMLCNIVRKTSGKTVAQILSQEVFEPMKLEQTGWYNQPTDNLVSVLGKTDEGGWSDAESIAGDKSNMYVSAQDLAYWGYLHMKGGDIGEKNAVPGRIIHTATSLQSPALKNRELPQNGFLWFVKAHPARQHEIGDVVPAGSYQILGYSTVTLLVIPKYDTVAVRMFNRWGSPPGYDYLSDVRSFGDTVARSFK
ncbi:serine hydrolase [Alicyclobacillus sp. SO9]|uniref:serine hydrolase domain-containing protein n=1 Tax=Alicyclobacillus sp. SO9 TaxID=2665646 RepID=UPI001E608A44|nr:serine hydrolase domain-containing protein [Alicyclobacillus sp. SO9]